MPSRAFDVRNWHWVVADFPSRAWSSAAASYVDTWPADGVTTVAGEHELTEALNAQGLRGPIASTADVVRERERRLALGFDFDFGAGRGTHRIGTTVADMLGWDEVSKLAAALVQTGSGSTTIDIVTSTGPVRIAAAEWSDVLIAAALFRQPIWAASFVLQSMAEIPNDYQADSYWIGA